MKSIGTDITEIARIKRSLDRFGESFVTLILSLRERELLPIPSKVPEFLAGRFAAKEAIYKALSTDRNLGIGWREMEILRVGSGRPTVKLSGRAQQRADELNVKDIHISISHCKTHALAFVCLE